MSWLVLCCAIASEIALSRADPVRPMDWVMPALWQASMKRLAVYSLSWSMWNSTPVTTPPRTAMATHSAARASSASWWMPVTNPTQRRELQVQHRRELEFAFVGGDFGEIPAPSHVGLRRRGEIAAQPVGGLACGLVRSGGAAGVCDEPPNLARSSASRWCSRSPATPVRAGPQ